MSDEQQLDSQEVLSAEDDLLRGLLEAANQKTENTKQVVIRRNGRDLFSFRVRGLSEAEYNACNDKATTYERNKRLGVKMPVDTDAARYRSYLIYEATVPEDRAKLWDNQQAWNQLNVLNGPDLIEKVLTPGEKSKVVELIDELSGYGDDATLEETAKN
jgi:hypothetical protein